MSARIRPLALCIFSNAGRILVNEADDPGATVRNVRYLGTLENIFTYLGEPGHEIVLVFDADFEDSSLYRRPFLEGRESNGEPFKASWRHLSAFGEHAPLFPDGLATLLREAWARQSP